MNKILISAGIISCTVFIPKWAPALSSNKVRTATVKATNQQEQKAIFQFDYNGKTYTIINPIAEVRDYKAMGTCEIDISGMDKDSNRVLLYMNDSKIKTLVQANASFMHLTTYYSSYDSSYNTNFKLFLGKDFIHGNLKLKTHFITKLNKMDMKNRVVSGTFEGNIAKDDDANAISVANGVFTNVPFTISEH